MGDPPPKDNKLRLDSVFQHGSKDNTARTLYYSNYHRTTTENEHGIYGGLVWQPTYKWMINWYADYAHFAWQRYQVSMPSDAFDTMVFARSLLYNFSSLMLYGKGIRYAFMTRADIGKHWMMMTKIGVTNYFDRSKISSGQQEIDGSSMADIDVQIRYKY